MTDVENGMIETYTYEGAHPNEDVVKVMTELLEKAIDQLLD